MTIVVVTPQIPRTLGVAPSYQAFAAADTLKIRNNGRIMLHFLKSGAGEATVTVTTPGNVGGLAVADRTIAVPATVGDVMAGAFPPELYNNADGDLVLNTNEGTGLSVAVMDI